MKRYVVLVGGTGARVAEAVLCGACAGVFQADELEVLLADTDRRGTRSASLLSAKYADYDRMQVTAEYLREEELSPFHTRLGFRAWPEQLPAYAQTLEQWASAEEDDALLCEALFDQEALRLDLREGFHGRTELGKAVFSGLLHEAMSNPGDSLYCMTEEMCQALDAGEEVRVVLAGSVCGATGAAGLPLLARFIRERTQGRAWIGAVLLAASGDHEDPARAIEGISGFAREMPCDAVCVLGLPRSSCSQAPADYAHLTDWLAVYCMDVLLHRPQWPSGLFTVKTECGPLSWSIFGKMARRYRLAYGRLIKGAAAWVYSVGPRVSKRLHRPFFLRDSLLGWYAHFFRGAGNARQAYEEDAAAMTRLMSVVLLWLGGLMRTLPPEMRHAAELTAVQEEARAHYDGLTALVSQLSLLGDDVQKSVDYEYSFVYRHETEEEDEDRDETLHRIDAVKREIARREEAQEQLSSRLGGFASMQLLQEALAQAEADCEELDERYREANRRIDHAEAIATPEDQYRIEDARTKLDRMVRHRQVLQARKEYIREDAADALTSESRFDKPAFSGKAEADGMFCEGFTERLLPTDRRLTRAEVEKLWSALVLPRDGVALRRVLWMSKYARVDREAPVMSLLFNLIVSALEEVRT